MYAIDNVVFASSIIVVPRIPLSSLSLVAVRPMVVLLCIECIASTDTVILLNVIPLPSSLSLVVVPRVVVLLFLESCNTSANVVVPPIPLSSLLLLAVRHMAALLCLACIIFTNAVFPLIPLSFTQSLVVVPRVVVSLFLESHSSSIIHQACTLEKRGFRFFERSSSACSSVLARSSSTYIVVLLCLECITFTDTVFPLILVTRPFFLLLVTRPF